MFFPAAQSRDHYADPRPLSRRSLRPKERSSSIRAGSRCTAASRAGELKKASDKTITAIRPGEQARTEAIEVKECRTKPPARFNEGTLLSAMEGAGKLVDDEELREAMSERGLGTPATRAQIIEGLIYEGYLLRQGKELIVTQKGISLITLLRDLHAEALTKPELTGEWEFKLKQMERGKLSREAFMGEIRQLTTDLVGKVRTGMGKEIRGEFHPLAVKCPRCGGGPYKESFKAYECESGCKTIVWKTMAGREFRREEVVKLLTEGRVGPLEGLPLQAERPQFRQPWSSSTKRASGNRNSISERMMKPPEGEDLLPGSIPVAAGKMSGLSGGSGF